MLNSIESLSNAWIVAAKVKYTELSTGKGIKIGSRSSGLAFGLTNPIFSTPKGYMWSLDYYSKGTFEYREMFKLGFEYEGNIYWDVEQAYQELKNKHEIRHHGPEGRSLLMIDMIFSKFVQYPFLYDKVKERGGLELISDSIHQPTKKDDYWNTSGFNAFIKCLYAAYYMLQ